MSAVPVVSRASAVSGEPAGPLSAEGASGRSADRSRGGKFHRAGAGNWHSCAAAAATTSPVRRQARTRSGRSWPGPRLMAAVWRVTARPPGRSACRPGAQENAVPGWARTAYTWRRGRWRCGRPARRRAGGRRSGSRGRRWPGGCGGRRSLRARFWAGRSTSRRWASRSSACPASANMAMFAVVASRIEGDGLALGVVAGQRDDRRAVSLRPGRPGPGWPCLIRSCRSASMRSARSIWWQAAPKFSPIGPGRGPRLSGIAVEPGRLEMVGVGRRSGRGCAAGSSARG